MTADATETPPHLGRTSASVRIALAFKKCDRLLTGQGGFGADVNETAGTGRLGSAEHMQGALHVDASPGVRRSPLLDEGGGLKHDLSASEVGRDHRIEVHLGRLGPMARIFWSLDDDRDMARTRCPSAASRRAAAPLTKPEAPVMKMFIAFTAIQVYD